MSSFPYQRFVFVLLLIAAAGGSVLMSAPGPAARVLPIAADTWTGRPVSVGPVIRPGLFTHHHIQYAAYFDAHGFLVLAKRTLGSDTWETRRTSCQGDVAGAGGSISLAVDGAGWLHVAWQDRDHSFRQARSTGPGSLQLAAPSLTVGAWEGRVTSPQFFLLPGGDLLLLYCAGAADRRGTLALSRYSAATQAWSVVQSHIAEVGDADDPSWTMAVDQRGGLHLAWTWCDSPGTATAHDLAYARSADGGVTWTKSDGTPCPLPVTAASCEYAAHISAGRILLGLPGLATDENDRPYIAGCWSSTPDAPPQLQIVHHDGTAWQLLPGPVITQPSRLAGPAVNPPPVSRPVLLVDSTSGFSALHLIYRDEARSGRILIATRDGRDAGPWVERELTGSSAGGWEPAIDPIAWTRFLQAHLLVAGMQPADGDGQQARSAAGLIGTLVWAPATQRMRTQTHAEPATVMPGDSRPPAPAAMLALMQRAADWQWAHLPDPLARDPRGWEIAPFYIGALALDRIAPDHRNREVMLRQAAASTWQPPGRIYHADDQCVIQAYLELYRLERDPLMLAPSRQRFDAILAQPPLTPVEWGIPNSQDRWTWCDALFMAPTGWAMMAQITGDRRYLEFMNREWWATTDALFNPATGFFARDESYLDLREPNGRTIHWARGNGWAFAGLCRVLDQLPPDHPDLPRYRQLYGTMAAAVLGAQQPDGLWRVGLLDPGAHPARETSGSAFLTFGLAWGLNRGLLARRDAGPAVCRAWNALAECVTAAGRLEHVQPIGAAPQGFDPGHTDTFAVGAFLLAGSEVYRLAGGAEARIQ